MPTKPKKTEIRGIDDDEAVGSSSPENKIEEDRSASPSPLDHPTSIDDVSLVLPDSHFRLTDLPDDILNKIAHEGTLEAKDLSHVTTAGKKKELGFFRPIDMQTFWQQVAYGRQVEAKAILDKEKNDLDPERLRLLLCTRSVITDYAGYTFKQPKLTPFQYAYWANDWHMLGMLKQYLSEEDQKDQLEELRNNKVKHGLVLMTVDSEQNLDDLNFLKLLRRLSSQNNNKPILLKKDNTLHLYGYDFLSNTWKLTTPEHPEVFQGLDAHFPNKRPFRQCHLYVRPFDPPQIEDVPEGHSAYILVQAEPGIIPSKLFFIDRTDLPIKVEECSFPLNQNMSTFTRRLFPNAQGQVFIAPDGELNREQLEAIFYTTGQPLVIMEKDELSPEMFNELRKSHAQGTEHGMHYDFTRLIEALETYVANQPHWSVEECKNYWTGMVGGEQRKATAALVAEYCHPNRPFYPTPNFDEVDLPRVLSYFNYASQQMES